MASSLTSLAKHPDFPQALRICQTLQSRGRVAWFAGGCVRDGLLGRSAKDIDIVTDAAPDEVQSLFPKTLAIGKQFGIIVVVMDEKNFDVATFRSDGAYVDGRHPSEVHFSSPKEDAERRDFTINAMFYDPLSDEVVDLVQGKLDLQKRLIRTVGSAKDRFREDKLRILRAVRFASELGFDLCPQTEEAIPFFLKDLTQVSTERQWIEVKKFLAGRHRARAWEIFVRSGLFEALIPELQQPGVSRDLAPTLKVLPENLGPVSVLATLFMSFDSSKPPGASDQSLLALQQFLERMKSSGQERQEAKGVLVGLEMLSRPQRLAHVRKLAAKAFAADLLAIGESLSQRNVSFPILDQFRKHCGRSLPAPLVKAPDLFAKGLSPGPLVGQILETAYDLQLEDESRSKDELIEMARSVPT